MDGCGLSEEVDAYTSCKYASTKAKLIWAHFLEFKLYSFHPTAWAPTIPTYSHLGP